MLYGRFLTTKLIDRLIRPQTQGDIFLTVFSLLLALDEQRGIQRKCNHYEQPCSVLELRSLLISREFKQITAAGAIMAAVTEKVWGEYVSVVCQVLSLASKAK